MTPSRRRGAATGAVVLGAAFVALTLLMAAGVTRSVDLAARDFFRPNHEWTQAQALADVVVEGLRPVVVATLLAIAGIGSSLHRRSWAPTFRVTVIATIGGLSALAAKMLVGRSDPSNQMSTVGGSFPSGHVVSVLVCLGGAVLVLAARPRWWQWALVGTAAGAMGYGLLLHAAHWLTDVVGGALLGLTVLAAASACGRGSSPRKAWSAGSRRNAGPGRSTGPARGLAG